MLVGLLLSASAAWGQVLFNDLVQDEAMSCVDKEF
jgi:hypothetical protein